MKPTRRTLVMGCRVWLCSLQCLFVFTLISCASVQDRVAQRKSDAQPDVVRAAATEAQNRVAANSKKSAIAAVKTSDVSGVDLPLPSSPHRSSQGADADDPNDTAVASNAREASRRRRNDGVRTVSAEDEVDPDLPAPDIVIPKHPIDKEVPAPSERDSTGTDAPKRSKGEIILADAPLEEGDLSFPINLASAMRLSDARPLVIAAAQAGAWVAEAKLQRAQLIWVPTLNLGGDYVRHDGYGPDFNRALNTSERPLSQNINFLYAGAGATASFGLTDAIYEPLAARQVLDARRMDIQTAKNDALLETAKAYFDVHRRRGEYAGALDTVQRGQKLVERIGHLSDDLVPKVEFDRAKRLLAEVQQNAVTARERWRIASANLTQVLRLDPRVIVDPAEQDHLQVTLFDPARSLDELIPIALCNRPELASHQSLVAGVAERIRREKGRILLPSIMLNGFQTPNEYIQVGAQGFGANKNLNLWSARNDISPQVLWQLDALGIGNLARIKEQRGEQSRAIVELFKVQDAVAADVTRAQARVQSAAVRVIQAERSATEAIITYEGNYEGLAETRRFANILNQVFRPQEAVVALYDLCSCYDRYFSTVAEYNRAQFEMFHALGYPALDASNFIPPGEAIPVDTSRPAVLPPVESGPPAATR